MAHQQAMVHQQVPPRDLLYNDAYISKMVEPLEAARYFTRLLQFDERHLHLVNMNGIIFIIHPAVQHARPSTLIANRPAWLLDYIYRDYGTVVPQSIWSPATAGDAQRYCNVPLNMPIFFVHGERGILGLRLAQATAGRIEGLLNGRAPAPIGNGHTTSIRIKWPGYNEWTTQIMTRDQTQAQNIISLETLAARVARAVSRFLELFARQQSRRPAWQVGPGGITATDVILIGLIHVTQGSWQPILQLNRYIFS